MALDSLEHGINIKDLTLEQPVRATNEYFDPKRDIPKSYLDEHMPDAIRKLDWDVLSDIKVFDSNAVEGIMTPSIRSQLSRAMNMEIKMRAANFGETIGTQRSWLHFVKILTVMAAGRELGVEIESNPSVSSRNAEEYRDRFNPEKNLFDEQDLVILQRAIPGFLDGVLHSEESKRGIIDYIKNNRERVVDLLPSPNHYNTLANMKLIMGTIGEKFEVDRDEWKALRAGARDYLTQGVDPFSRFGLWKNMKILAAETAKIDKNGLIVLGDNLDLKDSAPPVPEGRKF